MGQEIADTRFDAEAFAEFRRRVAAETRLLGEWIGDGLLRSDVRRFGLEVEAWLIDRDCAPAPRNQAFIEALADPLVVPELALFNFELNTEPEVLGPGALERMHAALEARWQRCRDTADSMRLRPLLTGILPTVRSDHLTLRNMSPLKRYRAINDQVFRLRHGEPILLDISGREHLRHRHQDVMLESATTSLQIHVEVDAGEAARAFNVCKMLSALTVGASGNSPYLFGRELWQETRIPLFEQAVAVGGSDYSKRVTFGVRYARDSIMECFEANRDRYPVILPDLMDQPPEHLAHLRLHNGTIWRWNRPLIGFDAAGRPHCRIEHRVIAAGPSVLDVIANAVLFLGLFEHLMRAPRSDELRLPFGVARDNFYAAAHHGLESPVRWSDGRTHRLGDLLGAHLLTAAADGLLAAGVPRADAEPWLDILRERVTGGQTGSAWQTAWVGRHGADFAALVDAYSERQAGGRPVHEWSLS
jgi:hypothetical protein